ncbi:natural resistance-associated macrophage protein-domain-containing protein [Cladochytrium replicatum]|nr:natural resistance-associated macrophage protein-domain-containing protein [Cladochytrium replicatum]
MSLLQLTGGGGTESSSNNTGDDATTTTILQNHMQQHQPSPQQQTTTPPIPTSASFSSLQQLQQMYRAPSMHPTPSLLRLQQEQQHTLTSFGPYEAAADGAILESRRPLRRSFNSAASSSDVSIESDVADTFAVMTPFQRTVWFLGPAFVAAIGYVGAPNWQADLVAGSSGYSVIVALLSSNLIAVSHQYLSVKLSIVTGKDFGQSVHAFFSPGIAFTVVSFGHIAVVASTLAQIIGSSMAIKILFGITLPVSVLITTILSVAALIPLEFKRQRPYELGAIAIIGVLSAWAVVFVSLLRRTPDSAGLDGSGDSYFETEYLYPSLGLIGSAIVPHSLFIHSYLGKLKGWGSSADSSSSSDSDDESRSSYSGSEFDRESNPETGPLLSESSPPVVNQARRTPSTTPTVFSLHRKTFLERVLRFSLLDTVLGFGLALVINVILAISAQRLPVGDGSAEKSRGLWDAYSAISRIPNVGLMLSATFATALLISSMVGSIASVFAGQVLFEGFVGRSWNSGPLWFRRLLLRLVTAIPAMLFAFFCGDEVEGRAVTEWITLSRTAVSVVLPMTIVPLIIMTSSGEWMSVRYRDFSLPKYMNVFRTYGTMGRNSYGAASPILTPGASPARSRHPSHRSINNGFGTQTQTTPPGLHPYWQFFSTAQPNHTNNGITSPPPPTSGFPSPLVASPPPILPVNPPDEFSGTPPERDDTFIDYYLASTVVGSPPPPLPPHQPDIVHSYANGPWTVAGYVIVAAVVTVSNVVVWSQGIGKDWWHA